MFDGHAGEPPKREVADVSELPTSVYARGLDHILTEEFVLGIEL